MFITLNGEDIKLSTTKKIITIRELFGCLNLSVEGRFVELNSNIYQIEQFDEISVHENDTVEIIQFMGGGDYSSTHS